MPLIRHLAENMKGVELVDEDYGQLEMIDDENRDTYPLVFPSVLVDAPTPHGTTSRGFRRKVWPRSGYGFSSTAMTTRTHHPGLSGG